MTRLKITSGDYLEFEMTNGSVTVKPKKLVDADQAWFWSKEWQAAERQADEDIEDSKVSKVFETADEGIAYLRQIRKLSRETKKKKT